MSRYAAMFARLAAANEEGDAVLVVGLSGRGDKDMAQVQKLLEVSA